MRVKRILENDASREVRANYEAIKTSFGLPRLPLFFTYFGAFPEYLDHITKQLVANIGDPRFVELCRDLSFNTKKQLKQAFPKSGELTEWLQKIRLSPSYYNFLSENEHIHMTNTKIAYIFIALREAIKGWGIAVKKLPGKTLEPTVYDDEEEFIYTDISVDYKPASEKELAAAEKQPISSSIEVDLLPKYLSLCRNEYGLILNRDEFWIMRVAAEKTILDTLPLFPHLIHSPINVVFKLMGNYPNYPDFLYLLSEHFPTYAVQRMMFSAYLLS